MSYCTECNTKNSLQQIDNNLVCTLCGTTQIQDILVQEDYQRISQDRGNSSLKQYLPGNKTSYGAQKIAIYKNTLKLKEERKEENRQKKIVQLIELIGGFSQDISQKIRLVCLEALKQCKSNFKCLKKLFLVVVFLVCQRNNQQIDFQKIKKKFNISKIREFFNLKKLIESVYNRVFVASANVSAVFSADEKSLEKKHRGMINKIKQFLQNNQKELIQATPHLKSQLVSAQFVMQLNVLKFEECKDEGNYRDQNQIKITNKKLKMFNQFKKQFFSNLGQDCYSINKTERLQAVVKCFEQLGCSISKALLTKLKLLISK